MSHVLITGANSGIGLELCRQMASRGDTLLAACRRSSPELDELGVEVRTGIDVTADAAADTLVEAVGRRPLDVLIHSAGILTHDSLEDLELDSVRRQIEVNALGPLRITKALLPRLQQGAKVVVLTSLMGSMTDNGSGGYYGYRMSKAAVNAAGVSMARDLEGAGISVALLHPGMVATRMTGNRGVSVTESASGLLALIDAWGPDRSGQFWHARGEPLPW